MDRQFRYILICGLILFGLLLYKDPFSQRTLIPNLEPFPDTIHYIVPARSLASGDEFLVKREGRSLIPSVKPIYSLILVPGYLLNKDPRFFYFTNFILALLSAFLFFSIIRRITNNLWILALIFLLYITNYFIYWFPNLAMAENLLLPLYLGGVWLILEKVSIKKSSLVGILSLTFYMTKSAAAPLTASFLFIYAIKVFIEKRILGERLKFWVALGLGFILMLVPTLLYDSLLGRDNILTNLFSLASSGSPVVSDRETPTSSAWFSPSYINKNLPLYLNALIGGQMRFLWDFTPIVPKFAGLGSILGLLIALFVKKMRFLSFSLIILLFSSILFISTFYAADARYIYQAIPTLLIGFAIFLIFLLNFLKNRKAVFYFIVGLLFLFYLSTSSLRLKNQISLNLKYAETPWYYISVLKMNEYFTSDKVTNNKKPVLISALPPYLIDYYANGNYTLLPLSYDQEFRGQVVREVVWGPNDYSNLLNLYKKYLTEGYKVYVSRAGLGNEGYTNRDFNTIVEEFDTKLVLEGCFNQCNIYSVKLK